MKHLIERLKSPTPSFWKKVRRVMIATGVICGAIVTAPVSLPASIVAIAGYGIVVGTVGTTLASLTKE
ncbi:MAG TPA: hypothetical protein VF868_15270 [Bacteroidia bacterium]|jgi:Sec-independent protein secretion pathway component TatC